MRDAAYYRECAAHARRLAETMYQGEVRKVLCTMAQDYDEIAEDLENGAIEIRHPDLMPQNDG
ncbi:MAG TPA: hypothetical protein VE993_08260 [Stellaceae bacterium]|nr:hypothetical protein [Stellaceae bacterium]